MEYSAPQLFNRGPAPAVRLLLCVLLSLALLIADARFKYLHYLRQAVAVVVYPLQRLAGAPGVLLARIGDYFVTQASLRNENTRLNEQTLRNAAALQQFQALQAENAQLRKLLSARERFPESTIAAEILYGGRDPFTRRIIIDKGGQNGVRAGYPVIDPIGVVGQVTRIYPWLSEVTLITDKGHSVPVQNVRNGLRAVASGMGQDGVIELKFIPLNADFQQGDQLVTSGIDGIYPPGLPVAVVSHVERNASFLFAKITCTPSAGVSSHGHLLVLAWESSAPPRPAEEEKAVPAKKKKGA